MYLKRIETLGFKSFADKTIINFNRGVTGVVGPNGSGKSNVVDAVRWVLGEQSVKQLRGGTTMTDVIFSGSKSRSAHSYAYVTLVLDNNDRYLDVDYTEVEITRKVFRNGESEYLLNGTKCRLKDIADIVIDTGLGKESFNIISQDKVASLLNSKPEDRRYIFEEAAGVLKYRKRKESAVRKLNSTDENLTRVNDILGELENQVEPLRIQSENARKYLEAKENLEAVEIALLAHEIQELNGEYLRLEKEMSFLNESIVSTTNNEYSVDKKIVAVKEAIFELDKNLEIYNQDYLVLVRKLDEAKASKKLFDERRKYSGEDDKILSNKRLLQNTELELNEKLNAIKESISSMEINKVKIEADFERLNEEHQEILNAKQKLRDLYSSTESLLIEQKSKVNAYESSNSNSLFSGVAAVLANPSLNGIIDIVSNVISIDSKFSIAIDYALGANGQFIICESKASAKSAIDYLAKFKKGRATFMPLDNINSKSLQQDFSSFDGIFGFASDLITTEERFKSVVESLVGNVVIAKDFDAANKFFETVKKYRIITLNGEIINPRGSITGGGAKKISGVFSARHEYEKSKSLIEEYDQTLQKIILDEQDLNKKLSNFDEQMYKQRILLMQTIENYNIKQDSLRNLEIEHKDIVSELSNMNTIIDSKEDEEEVRILESIKDFQTKISALSTKLDKLKFDKANLLVDRDELETEFKSVSIKLREDKKQASDIEVKLSRIEVSLDNFITRLSDEYELTFEKAYEDFHLNIEVVDARSKVRTLKSKISALGYVNVNAIEEFEVVNERFVFLSTQKEDIIAARDELIITIEELDKTMTKQFKETFDEVSYQYSKMFSKLFGGGSAALTLTDPDDLLNTGIDISAQPPGKKLQHLTLLSGGEKALSTLVLLFAILKVRPVPFCILDEVEAALDEANLARFAHFLDGFSTDIQFIIITHRKVTMENADILYGVTMQESGVSKLVSVRLSEATQLVGEVK